MRAKWIKLKTNSKHNTKGGEVQVLPKRKLSLDALPNLVPQVTPEPSSEEGEVYKQSAEALLCGGEAAAQVK